jgi:dipeptidyl aminopeptidase/acylaminoacyl peptidase
VIASSAQVPPRVLRLDRRGGVEVVARAAAESVAPAALAEPRHLSWTTAAGRPLHGLYYPPTSPRFASSGLPPAILMVHGGPNSQAHTAHNPRNQFFATRGYAVFEVNYRGSTGYGRAYRQALDGQWGVADLEDTVAASERLVELRLADPGRLVVMGSSAGGYTVLRALTARPGYFRAGVCVYGIANLFTLASGTHKLEERYLDSLLGVLPAAAAVYRERSPLFAVEALRDPVAVYHGADDQVVPPAQSEALVESLRRRQVPHEYRVFPGEGHGWRRPETIEAFFQSVEAFLRQHVLFA